MHEMTERVRIEVYSHFVKVTGFDDTIKEALLYYCASSLTQYDLVRNGQRFERNARAVYAARRADNSEFRFHRNLLEQVIATITNTGYPSENIERVEQEVYSPDTVDFHWIDKRTPRPDQRKIIDYGLAACDPRFAPSKLITANTGFGKTLCSMNIVHERGFRTAIVVKGAYVDKWATDVRECFKLKDHHIRRVSGTPSLLKLIDEAREGKLTYQFIIFGNRTLGNFYKNYEQYGVCEETGNIAPEELFPLLGIGTKMVDEAHMEFHSVYRQDLYTHVPYTLSMSATIDGDDRFVNRMTEVVWPPITRSPPIDYKAFIEVKALLYSLQHPDRIRCMNFMKQYNHILFEQSIMRNQATYHRYLGMITDIVRTAFVDKMQHGQKCIVFCSTVALCTRLAEVLAGAFPALKVNRYCQEDPYSDLLQGEIVVSTVLSAGTAVDVPNLRVTIQTIAINSKQSNIQTLGRTRPLKDWPDVAPEFYFLSAREIERHMVYARAKEEKFRGLVVSFEVLETPFKI